MFERKTWKGVIVIKPLVQDDQLDSDDDRKAAGEYPFDVEAHCKADAYENALKWCDHNVGVDRVDDFDFLVRFAGDQDTWEPGDHYSENNITTTQTNTFDEVLMKVDWVLLHEQKHCLWDLRGSVEYQTDEDAIDGVINLIDNLQDVAVDKGLWTFPE